MDNLTHFRKNIVMGTIIIAILCQIISFFLLGGNILFSIGLFLGTGVAIVNFFLMEGTLRRAIYLRNRWSAMFGYFIRLAIYGGIFYIAIRIRFICALGTGIGFFTLKIALIYLGIRGKL